MTRGRKKESLTLEERLRAALVPEGEQPYKVPENWCWVRVSSVCEFERGITFPASAKEKEPTNNSIPCLRTANVQGELEIDDLIYVDKAYMKNNAAKFVQKDDIIMSSANSRELVGKTSYVYDVPFPMTFGGFVLTIRAKKIISKYLFYFLRLEFLSGHFMGESTQTTNLANINTTKLGGYPLALPPASEQQRIVDRIESLFAKLDEAKQRAQDALDSFETRKAAILHKAFTGELTERWREEHRVEIGSWEKTALKNVCEVNPKKIDTNGLPDDLEVSFFPMASLSEIYGEITEPQTRLLKDVKTGFTNFSEGDVVFAKITPCMENGKSAVIGELVNGIGYGTTEFYVLRCCESLYNRFLHYMIRDSSFRNQAKSVMSGAVGQQRVPKSFMENYPLHLPSLPEQTEIVRILDELLAKEQQAREVTEAVLKQIDFVKKSVLAHAFRGGLGTNDPSEESSMELLKQSFSETLGNEKVILKEVIKPEAEVVFVPKTIMEALSEGARLTPENLKSETELPIDDFYAQLKELTDNGSVVESRENGESYLEAANANRQTENQQL